MFKIIISLCFVFVHFCGITCNDTINEIHVELQNGNKCSVLPNHTFLSGCDVWIIVKSNKILESVTIEFSGGDQMKPVTFKLNATSSASFKVTQCKEKYTLFFAFTYAEKNLKNLSSIAKVANDMQKCNTTVLHGSSPFLHWELYIGGIGVVLGIIIISLCGSTIYYRKKVKVLSRLRNLNMRTDRIEEEEQKDNRYWTKPLQKAKSQAELFDKDRESAIYEDPKAIGVTANPPPELPPTPRPDVNKFSTLKMPPSPPMRDQTKASPNSTFPRKKHADKIPISKRPPLPLPQDEIYNEAEEDDTYEPPPIHEILQQQQNQKRGKLDKIKITENISRPRPDISGKKPIHEKLGKVLPNIPMGGLKPPGTNKPAKPPIPQGKPLPPRNKESKPLTPQSAEVKLPPTFPQKYPEPQTPNLAIPENRSVKKPPQVKPKPPIATPNRSPSPIRPTQHDDCEGSSDDEYWGYTEHRSDSPIYSNSN